MFTCLRHLNANTGIHVCYQYPRLRQTTADAVSLLPTDYKKKMAKRVRGSGAFVPSQSCSGSATARGMINGRIFIPRLHILSSVGPRASFFPFFLWPRRLNYAHSVVVSSNCQGFIAHQNVIVLLTLTSYDLCMTLTPPTLFHLVCY